MKIKEINQLVRDEKEGKLRLPKLAKNKSEEELKAYQTIMTAIVKGVIENPNADMLLATEKVQQDLKQEHNLLCRFPKHFQLQ